MVKDLQKKLKVFQEELYGHAKYSCEVSKASQTKPCLENKQVHGQTLARWGSENRFN